jgi:hypothetical protein
MYDNRDSKGEFLKGH